MHRLKSNSLNDTYTCPYSVNYFWGRLLREDAESILKSRGGQLGFYLLRESTCETGIFILSICASNKSFSHFLMERLPNDKVKIETSSEFNDPIALIEYNKNVKLDGLKVKPEIPCNRTTQIFYFNLISTNEFENLTKTEISNSNQYYKYVREIVRNLHLNKSWFIDSHEKGVKNLLNKNFDGQFLVRRSSEPGLYVIHLSSKKKINDYKIMRSINEKFQLSITSREFDSLFELVDHYSRTKGLGTFLKHPYRPSEERPPEYEKTPYSVYVDEEIDRSKSLTLSSNSNQDSEKSESILTDDLEFTIEKQAEDSNNDNGEIESQDNEVEPLKINPNCLVKKERLGVGDFGEVNKYILTTKEGNFERELQVAGKKIQIICNSLNDYEIKKYRERINNEAKIMFNLKCPYIIDLIGVCDEPNSLLLLLEFAPLGSLKEYLKKNADMHFIKIIKCCYQVCVAMEYLASKNIVHRDIACRNVLLFKEDFAKISDFGMSRELEDCSYYRALGNSKTPFKYIPPEIFDELKFSEKTDVWAFGITFWEAMTYGSEPYSKLLVENIKRYLENNNRLEKPDDCPKEIYESILLKCWDHFPNKRPNFSDLRKTLKSIIFDVYRINMDNQFHSNSTNFYQE